MIKNILPITELKLKVLSEIYKYFQLNLTAISNNTGIETPNVLRVIKELESVIEIKEIGGIKLYTIKTKYIKFLELIIETYRLEINLGVKSEIIDIIKANINFSEMYIFGSYAKNTANKNSDLDLVIISDTDKKVIKEKINSFNKKANINIEPVIFKINEFEELKKDKNSNYHQILFVNLNERIRVF